MLEQASASSRYMQLPIFVNIIAALLYQARLQLTPMSVEVGY